MTTTGYNTWLLQQSANNLRLAATNPGTGYVGQMVLSAQTNGASELTLKS